MPELARPDVFTLIVLLVIGIALFGMVTRPRR
jgi:hypothetical protein